MWGRNDLGGAKRLGDAASSGGETTRGKRPGGGKRLGAKRLGEEMVWERNDPEPFESSWRYILEHSVSFPTKLQISGQGHRTCVVNFHKMSQILRLTRNCQAKVLSPHGISFASDSVLICKGCQMLRNGIVIKESYSSCINIVMELHRISNVPCIRILIV